MIKGLIFRWFSTDSIGIHHLFLPFFVPSTWSKSKETKVWGVLAKPPRVDLIIHAPPKKSTALFRKVGEEILCFQNPPLWSSDASGHHQGYAYTMQNSADPWAYERRQYWVPMYADRADEISDVGSTLRGRLTNPKNTGLFSSVSSSPGYKRVSFFVGFGRGVG